MADLEDYIKRALGDDTASVFNHGVAYRPQLRQDRKNRILLYPGSFNPPHVGHLDLMQHAFENCQDINVIAAIVIPLDDDRVRSKCVNIGQDLQFTREQRVQLWRGNTRAPWYWVFDGSEWKWDKFRERLEKAVIRDGFDLRFVLLCGPDWVQTDSIPGWNAWDCEDIVVSDISRPADFVRPFREPLGLDGCGPWMPLCWSDGEIHAHARNMADIRVSYVASLSTLLEGSQGQYPSDLF